MGGEVVDASSAVSDGEGGTSSVAALASAAAAARPSTNEKSAAGNDDDGGLRRFEMAFEKLRGELLDDFDALPIEGGIAAELRRYFGRMLDHCCRGGKMTRGLTVVKAATFAAGRGAELDEETWQQAAILGWCVEVLQAFFLTADDVMDSSLTRRGAPCWYKLPDVTAANAINDALFLNTAIFRILERHFGSHPEFGRLSSLFHFAIRMTVVGQHIDTNAQPFGETTTRLDRFTYQRYSAETRQKTAYYTFFLPCALGLALVGKLEKVLEDKLLAVCLEMGEYFQAQDDFLDCYGHPDVLGKVGTDIQEGKCTWLIVEALPLLTEDDRKKLQETYGRNDDKSVAWVKALYGRLHLETRYRKYEEESYRRCSTLIDKVDDDAARQLLKFLLSKIHRREK